MSSWEAGKTREGHGLQKQVFIKMEKQAVALPWTRSAITEAAGDRLEKDQRSQSKVMREGNLFRLDACAKRSPSTFERGEEVEACLLVPLQSSRLHISLPPKGPSSLVWVS